MLPLHPTVAGASSSARLWPVVTVAGLQFSAVISGAVVVETVFSWPGVGRLTVEAVMGLDFPIVQGVTLMVAVIVLTVNLLVDILYAYIDPQIRYQRT